MGADTQTIFKTFRSVRISSFGHIYYLGCISGHIKLVNKLKAKQDKDLTKLEMSVVSKITSHKQALEAEGRQYAPCKLSLSNKRTHTHSHIHPSMNVCTHTHTHKLVYCNIFVE